LNLNLDLGELHILISLFTGGNILVEMAWMGALGLCFMVEKEVESPGLMENSTLGS